MLPPNGGLALATAPWLAKPDSNSVVLWQDGEPVTEAAFEKTVRSLANLLSQQKVRRWALRAARADLVAAAIVASEIAGCEVLLTRATQPREAEVWRSWAVSLVLNERLEPEWMEPSFPAPDEGVHILIETSGTTGVPKVARHSLDTLMGRLRAGGRGKRDTRWLLTYHPAGFGGLQVLLTALSFGEPLIALTRPTAPTLAQAALQYKPTHISATPTFWRGLLVALGEAATQVPLRQATLGGEIAEQTLLDRLRRLFPVARLTHIYALTEAGAVFSVHDGLAGFPESWLESGIDGVHLRVREGVLEVLSPREMASYVGATPAPRTPDGWIRTGDLVDLKDGRVHFRGRADSMLSVGGSKVMPEEVEAMLMTVPGVLDARVYGVRNPITGFLVAAEIVSGDADREGLRKRVIAAARATLDSYKVPRQLHFVHRLELSAMGKKGRSDGGTG